METAPKGRGRRGPFVYRAMKQIGAETRMVWWERRIVYRCSRRTERGGRNRCNPYQHRTERHRTSPRGRPRMFRWRGRIEGSSPEDAVAQRHVSRHRLSAPTGTASSVDESGGPATPHPRQHKRRWSCTAARRWCRGTVVLATRVGQGRAWTRGQRVDVGSSRVGVNAWSSNPDVVGFIVEPMYLFTPLWLRRYLGQQQERRSVG